MVVQINKITGNLGEINYQVGSSALDIAYPNAKIYIEYDGSGHWLNVHKGGMSMEEFNKKEANRYYALKDLGWRMIRVVSENNTLPKNNARLINAIDHATLHLMEGGNWFNINLTEGYIECINYKKGVDFGPKRRILKEDVYSSVS